MIRHAKLAPAGVTRRNALKLGAAAAGLVACPTYVSGQASTLVVNSQGGEYQELFERIVVKPFEQAYGVTVINDATGTASEDMAKIRASGGSPGFDVAANLTPPEAIIGGREGLLDPLTEAEVPNLAKVWSSARDLAQGFGAVHTVQYAALIYNKNEVERPSSWAHYWQPGERYGDRIKNHVIGFNPANLLSVFALLHAAELGGGGVENMEPAWELLAAQKPYLGVVVTGSSEAVPHFENGQVWIAPYWSGRSSLHIDRGIPFDMVLPDEGVYGLPDVASVPVGAANKELAYKFIDFRLSKDVQREFSLAYHAGPGRNDIDDFPPDFLARHIASQDRIDQTKWPDLAVIGEKRRDWTLRWQEVMG